MPQWIGVFEEDFPDIVRMARHCSYYPEFEEQLRNYVYEVAYGFYGNSWDRALPITDYPVYSAAKRIFRTFQTEGQQLLNKASGEVVDCRTFEWLWQALRGNTEGIETDFLIEIYHLFKQLYLTSLPEYSKEEVQRFIHRWHTGMEDHIFYERLGNRMLIIARLVEKIENRQTANSPYRFEEGMSYREKQELVNQWWYDFRFQLAMAIRNAGELNRFLGHSLSAKTMEILYEAERKKIPFFITPYYLSLLSSKKGGYDDRAIRCYVIYSRELVEKFGSIKAWEKEDTVEPGKPNAAGWLLPNTRNIHRRYPEVAIFIPDTRGRACGGLCALCQRMYNFQQGYLNFDLDKLLPEKGWEERLEELMAYFEQDSQLRDILITGGDALMSRNETLKKVLEAVVRMAGQKREANKLRPEGEKYAEIQRIRLGSRLLVYLPFRIDEELIRILRTIREEGSAVGISRFILQTHFESPLEVTVEVRSAVQKVLNAGWLVTNQLVYTAAASRRGHTACLRQVLNRIGVIPYYTFTVKGFEENQALYAPVCRSVQEQQEEKSAGRIQENQEKEFLTLAADPAGLREALGRFLNRHDLPFIATDRNVMNLPGIGKSMSFSTVGVTREGKRILCFSLDMTRPHSPAVNPGERIYVVENKSVAAYLRQLEKIGENPEDYQTLWYYNEGRTERRCKVFEYPVQNKGVTDKYTHLYREE